MKSLLIYISFFVCVLAAQSQQVAPNFTLIDIDGNSHELYEYLDQNKVVILDFYAEWCGPCQENAAGVEAIWEAYGPDGTDEVMILGIEADDDSTDDQVAQYAIDWNCSNPQINDTGEVPDWYGIEYFPTYFVVCPDRTYLEYFGDSDEIEEVLLEGISGCGEWLELSTDARIFSYNSSTVLCSEETTPTITLMNMGNNTLNSVVVDFYLNGDLQESLNWTGSLAIFETEIVSFETIDLSGLSDPNVLIQTSLPNGIEDENTANDSAEVDLTYGGVNYETPYIRFELAFDNFPQETDWEILNSQGAIVASGGGYLGFPDFSPPIDMQLNLPLNDCYTFNIYDSAGDGICCTYADPGEGFWRISTSEDVLIAEGGTFTNMESALFGITGIVNLSENALPVFNLYPNPANSEITLELEGKSFQWIIFGMDGRICSKGNQVGEKVNIDISSMTSGTYFVHVLLGDLALVQKLIKL